MSNAIIKIKNYHTASLKMAIAVLLVCHGLQGRAQAGKNLVLAEQYYAAGDYYTAAGLYEQYLHPVKKQAPRANFPLNAKRYRTGITGVEMSKNEVLLKQAHSYRLAHYWKEAAERYKTCLEKDADKYADALYWYAVCQRSMNDYAGAEESIKKYLAAGGDTHFTAAARKELETLQFINTQLKRPDTVMYKILKANDAEGNEKGIYAPVAINNNRFLFTSTITDTSAKNGINPYHNRLFNASLNNGGVSLQEPIQINGADISANQGAAAISADGKHLYFTQWGKGKAAIYHAIKNKEDWSNTKLLAQVNSNGFNSKQPYCTADGKTLFFSSDRPGGAGGFDIWSAAINEDGTTGEPVNITAVNSPADEQSPFYHTPSNTLVFSSNGRTGMGGFDLFTSTLKEGQWTTPQNMGHPVNSSRDDVYYYAAQEGGLLQQALFSSDRGSGCCLETYTVTKAPKKKKISGIVKDSKNNEPIAEATVAMKDKEGKVVQATTAPDGTFSFDISGNPGEYEFTVTKDKYKDKTEQSTPESVNDSDWSTDVVSNAPILLEKKLVIKPETVVTIFFDFDKYDIKQRSAEVLDSLFTVLNEDPTATLQVSGYTDGLGSVEYNNILADKRARACADYLIAKGIDAARITFESFGECCPVEMEIINGRDNPDGRSKNRRALINVTKEEK